MLASSASLDLPASACGGQRRTESAGEVDAVAEAAFLAHEAGQFALPLGRRRVRQIGSLRRVAPVK
jgi:hypothetical protein